jgi:NAD(P)-dependent dehydrogenase (short-subunit alcohol dehydrogenase family)
MASRLDGKIAIVTGGSSGLGAAISALFASEGATVVVADINEPLATAPWPDKTRCAFLRCDVTREEDIRTLIAEAERRFGGLDILVNNAGANGATAPIASIEISDWEQTFALCLRSGLLGMKHALPAMKRRGGGSIINTASVAGLRPSIANVAYSVAKAGVIQLTRMAAMEFASDLIRVNAICPGVIPTPAFADHFGFKREDAPRVLPKIAEAFNAAQPWPRAGRPQDIAEMALFLASDASGYVTGQEFVVDGGLLLAPPATLDARPEGAMMRAFELAARARSGAID